MASQITHIVVTEKLYPILFTQYNQRDFTIGTVFPDIRFLGELNRDASHWKGVTLATVLQETDSFRAGVLFHNLYDVAREDYLLSQGVYEKYPDTYPCWTAMKLYEDELLYSKVTDWDRICTYLDTITEEERQWGMSEEGLQTWHTGLRRYCAQAPNEESVEGYKKLCGTNEALWDQVGAFIPSMRQDPYLAGIEEALYQSLETVVTSYEPKGETSPG